MNLNYFAQFYYEGPHSQFGIMGLQGKNWDYGITPCLKLGLQKSCLNLGLDLTSLCGEIGIMGLHSIWNWDYGITPHLKLGLWDYAPFEIGIMGLQDPLYGGHYGGRVFIGLFDYCPHPEFCFLQLWDFRKCSIMSYWNLCDGDIYLCVIVYCMDPDLDTFG